MAISPWLPARSNVSIYGRPSSKLTSTTLPRTATTVPIFPPCFIEFALSFVCSKQNQFESTSLPPVDCHSLPLDWCQPVALSSKVSKCTSAGSLRRSRLRNSLRALFERGHDERTAHIECTRLRNVAS